MNLLSSLESVKGVGPRTAKQFSSAGLDTVGDLITFLPYRYDDFSEVVAIKDLTLGKRTIRGVVESISSRRVRGALMVTTATIVDSSGKVGAVWFNQPYRAEQFKSGSEYYFSGEFAFRAGRYALTSPSSELVSDLPVSAGRLVPIYHQIRGLKSQLVRKVLTELRPLMTVLPETLPDSVIQSNHLIAYGEAIIGMHFPQQKTDIDHARYRLGFEELFQLALASELNRHANQKLVGYRIATDIPLMKDFISKLPFQLTDAQRLAIWEIIQDLDRAVPMNRMLQGDVGSGKTVVASAAALQVARRGSQTAILAPTEVLARQHAETLDQLLAPFGISVTLLTGSTKGKVRQALLQAVEDGTSMVIVGTHALLQSSVKFHQLGLVVIDEQHRFGVDQRQQIALHSKVMPHLLSMTATPIPRTLQLTLFGELDISILRQKPANRLQIITKLVGTRQIDSVYRAIDDEITNGRQAYIICNLIDDSEYSDKKSVEREYHKLSRTVFAHRSIGLLHGKLKPAEKQQIMTDFANHKYDILISTTVVEVGVDVPNATVIMIEDAESYGLAQLHQLRGRVGRSTFQSYCYLMLAGSAKPSERLLAIEQSNDGFYLAEVDLKLRGPGEIYGRAQHGELNLKIANLADTRTIKAAQEAARQFAASGEDLLHYEQLASATRKYQRLTTLN